MKPKLVLTGRRLAEPKERNGFMGFALQGRTELWWCVINGIAYEYRVQSPSEPAR